VASVLISPPTASDRILLNIEDLDRLYDFVKEDSSKWYNIETVIQSGRVGSDSEYASSYHPRNRRISHGASLQVAEAYQSPSLPPRSS